MSEDEFTHERDRFGRYNREFGVVEYIHGYDLDPDKREIYLFSREEVIVSCDTENDHGEPGVEYTMANRFIRNLRILQGLSEDDILIHMKTAGGDTMEGFAIYQAIVACPNHVTILNYTHARSMSSIILQAADTRAMLPHSVFMYHDGTIGFEGTNKQFWTEAEQFKVQEKLMFDIYLDRCADASGWEGKTRAQIKRLMRTKMDKKEEVYMSASDAVKYGFADIVFGARGVYNWKKLRKQPRG